MSDALSTMAAPASAIDEILALVEPPSETITVELAGKALTFRAIRDRSELQRLKRAAAQFALIDPNSVPIEEVRELYRTDAETMAMAYVMAETSISPKFTPVDLLKLAKRAALAFEQLKDQINAGHVRSIELGERQVIEDAKNESSETPVTETA